MITVFHVNITRFNVCESVSLREDSLFSNRIANPNVPNNSIYSKPPFFFNLTFGVENCKSSIIIT